MEFAAMGKVSQATSRGEVEGSRQAEHEIRRAQESDRTPEPFYETRYSGFDPASA
jgi:hypothetical protein